MRVWLAFCWGCHRCIVLQGLGWDLGLKMWWCPERLGNNTWGHHPCNLQKNVGFLWWCLVKGWTQSSFPRFFRGVPAPRCKIFPVLENPGCWGGSFPFNSFLSEFQRHQECHSHVNPRWECLGSCVDQERPQNHFPLVEKLCRMGKIQRTPESCYPRFWGPPASSGHWE